MARYKDAKCKLCRREGVKLFLKGSRCYSVKCPIEKKGAVPPGQHGTRRRRRTSDFCRQLREKQKAKRLYGILERQFKSYFEKSRSKKESGEALFQILESRLDNVVYRLGFTSSRSAARQIVNHGHIFVDGQKVDIASFLVKPGQVVSLTDKGAKIGLVKESLKEKGKKVPLWLSRKAILGKVIRLPKREEIEANINEDLIVEFYSR